jgi:hypothetical protein
VGKLGDGTNYDYLKVEATPFDLRPSSASNIYRLWSMN